MGSKVMQKVQQTPWQSTEMLEQLQPACLA
jgi:hypothetical protein